MVFTRADGKLALAHVIKDVFELLDDHPLHTSLLQAGIVEIGDVLSMPYDDILVLTYRDDKGDEHPVAKGDKYRLRIIKYYHHHRITVGDPIEDWLALTREEYHEYRVSKDYDDTLKDSQAPSAGRSSSSSSVPSPRVRDPIAEFKKGIRRDALSFAVYKDEKQWDTWQRSTLAQVRAQDVAEVLDATYVPTTPEEIALFTKKQEFMYAVFEHTLQTDQGKAFVRQHEQDYDAQKIYSCLQDYSVKSTKASLGTSKLLSYITSAKMGDGSWKGGAHAFILNWQDKIRLYEKQVSTGEQFSDALKRVMLQNAVHPLEELRAVKTQADQHKTQSGVDLTYEQYVHLLVSAATNYDTQFLPAERQGQPSPRRAVYAHAFDEHGETDIIDPIDGTYDIDMSVDTLHAYAAAHAPGSRMPFTRWQSLSEGSKAIWDTLPDSDKALILGNNAAAPARTSPGNRPGRPPRAQNVHSVDAALVAACLHEMGLGQNGSDTAPDPVISFADDPSPSGAAVSTLTAHSTKKTWTKPRGDDLPPSDIRKVLSSIGRTPTDEPDTSEITIKGKTYRLVNATIFYIVSASLQSNKHGSLMDRGANGGLAGDDTRVIMTMLHSVDIQGLDNHQVTNIPIVTAGAFAVSQRGPVIIILNQYAGIGRGRSIHSSAQLEAYGNDVNDRSIKVQGGLQRITTLDGYVFPLNIVNGLPYVTMRPYTDSEWDSLPHVVWTGDSDWDPTVLDHRLEDDTHWFDAITDLEARPFTNLFDEFGNYRNRVLVQHTELASSSHYVPTFFDALAEPRSDDVTDWLDSIVYDSNRVCLDVHHAAVTPSPRLVHTKVPTYEKFRPLFGWLPTDTIKRTFEITTQYARMPMSTILKKRYKSPNPAVNVHRRDEPVATDTVFSDTPAIDGGETAAQIFVGTKSFVTDVEGMKSASQFVNTLEDNIRRRGAPTKLISDRAQLEISNKVKDILRALHISDWQSEPHQQHQNPCERRYQTIKSMANTILDRTGSPAFLWLLCLGYVCFLLNNVASSSTGTIPIQVLTGSTNDISPLLYFRWYEPVYYKLDDSDFPSDSREKRGRWVGIAEHVGHAMTFKILTDDTRKIIYRSNIRSAVDPKSRNLRMEPLNDDPVLAPIIKSRHDHASSDSLHHGETLATPMPIVDPNDLVGRTFLMAPQPDGQRFRARIVRAIEDHERNLASNSERTHFLCSVNDDQFEEIMSYNDLLRSLEDDGEGIVWKFKRISAHQGPLTPKDKDWNGSSYNVMVEWENGEITTEPLAIIAADDPVSCAVYARDNNLLDIDGWKRFRGIAKRQQKLQRMVNQAKLRSFRTAPRFKYGYEVPRDFGHAKRLDDQCGNTLWMDATALELAQLHEYDTFQDYGHKGDPPSGFKKIRTHLVYDCKHDGRHKARMVADGHLTEVPLESVYSGVVSLRGLRMLVFLAELNGLEAWGTDIGNAYLEAETKERVYIVAGAEFGHLEGHTLVIIKALYGLRTSGLRWHERFADCLRDMGFIPSKAEPDIWMRPNGDAYEYIGVYVDDLAIIARNPGEIADILQTKYKFKLKGTGPITFHLGMDFIRDSDGVLCIAARKYVDKMVATYEQHFGSKPSQRFSSPLEAGDHPEINSSEFLDATETQLYQSLIGALQWAVSIGRFDITTSVMTLSSFRTLPRRGHLDRVKRIYGYLFKMKDAMIRIRTAEPDYSGLPVQAFDWANTVYGEVSEILPANAPSPLGKYVTLTHYFDANLFHDMLTGRSVTGILHLVNKTPLDWYSKKQATVETATYGSEFIAARTCVDQIVDLRTTLRYLGVPVRDVSYMFGDNKTVVDSSTILQSKLHKCHNALSFHRVREAVAAGFIGLYHLPGEFNPADIMTKHWGYQTIWRLLQPLLFYQGDTAELFEK